MAKKRGGKKGGRKKKAAAGEANVKDVPLNDKDKARMLALIGAQKALEERARDVQGKISFIMRDYMLKGWRVKEYKEEAGLLRMERVPDKPAKEDDKATDESGQE